MGADRESRVRMLFERAAGAEEAERRLILEAARAQDPEACARVEELLPYVEREGAVLDRTPAEMAATLREGVGPEAMPASIGRFTVVREVGRGGMGVVYEASQDFPKRRVALKVVRPELVTSSMLKRFAHEAEVLAMLQHPGIAQIFEAGFFEIAGARRPFIAMEFVEGRPLAAFAHGRGVGEILDLLASVCEAVDHAHRRGVVHRDLKPGNILVPAGGQPKILDFGVARLAGADTPEHTLTGAGQLIGTLGYMSPEQFEGDPRKVDHRADIYALGAILYELVGGRPPLEVGGLSLAGAAVALREKDPAPLGRLDPRLRGDIEAIAGKALEKSPGARYASAADLAADIRRHRNNEPVLARPQTTWYHARKFARRHRALVAGAGATVLALVLGAGGTSWQAVRATRQRDAAARETRRAKESAALLIRVLQASTPAFAKGSEPTVREMLDGAARDLERDDKVDPAIAGDTHRAIAEAFTSLGDFRRAETHARRALALHTGAAGPEDDSTLRDMLTLSKVLSSLDEGEEAGTLALRVLDTARRLRGSDDPVAIEATALYALALGTGGRRASPEAIKWLRECYERSRRVFGPTDRKTLTAASDLGVHLMEAHQDDEAERLQRDVLENRRRLLGEDHPETLVSLNNLAAVLADSGREEEAAQRVTELLGTASRILGPEHPSTLLYEGNLVGLLSRTGRGEEALPHARHIYESGLARLGPTHEDVLRYRGLLCNLLLHLKRPDEAEPLVREQYDLCLKNFGEKDQRTERAVTLQYDLAEAKGSLPGMREAAERLRGTEWEKDVFEQLAKAEEAAKAPSK